MTKHTSGARARREAAGLSRERLGRAADISTSTIALVEKGYRAGPDITQRLADALGCTVSDLYADASIEPATVVADLG